jgi:acyl-CoA hydrolase
MITLFWYYYSNAKKLNKYFVLGLFFSFLGDILLLGTKLSRTGNSTITLECEIKNKTTNHIIVKVEEVVIVALDENKKPTPHKLSKQN